MRIVYPPFVNHEGSLIDATADLEGNIMLNIKVKGKDGAIVMPVKEAVKLLQQLRKLDVESLASIYAP